MCIHVLSVHICIEIITWQSTLILACVCGDSPLLHLLLQHLHFLLQLRVSLLCFLQPAEWKGKTWFVSTSSVLMYFLYMNTEHRNSVHYAQPTSKCTSLNVNKTWLCYRCRSLSSTDNCSAPPSSSSSSISSVVVCVDVEQVHPWPTVSGGSSKADRESGRVSVRCNSWLWIQTTGELVSSWPTPDRRH